MTEATMSHGFTRRSFIKGVAAVTAAGALAGCTPKEDDKQQVSSESSGAEEIFAGNCAGNCAGGCFLNVHVRDGRVVRTTARDYPDTQYNRICSKGLTHVGRIYSANRLLYPMRRIEGTERGTAEFERISWDEAIEEIATKWKGYREEFGNEAVAVLNGSGNYHCASGVFSTGSGLVRFKNVIGSSAIAFNVDAAVGIGWQRAMGSARASGNESKDYLNAKTIVCWAANPSVSMLHLMHFITEAKENGTKYIVIDPQYNANAAKADWYIPTKAGTDGALAMGLLNVMLENGWIADSVFKEKTNGPFLIKEDGSFLRISEIDGSASVEGEDDPYAVWDLDSNAAMAYDKATNPALKGVAPIDGIAVQTAYENAMVQITQYDPATVSEITGIPEEDIRELARIYIEEGPVTTHSMQGNNHYINGHYNTWAMGLVAVLTGNFGAPGAGCGRPQMQCAHLLNAAVTKPADSAGNPCLGAGRTVITKEAGNVLETGLYNGEPLVIKSVYVQGTNPLCTFAERNSIVEWMKKIEFMIVADVCMTETCLFADIVLPAAYWFEQEDVFVAYGSHPYISLTEKAVEPAGEAKPDFEIQKMLVEALGYGDYWKETAQDYLTEALDTDAARAVGATFADLKEKKVAKTWVEENYVTNNGGVIPTETGRAGLYYDTVVGQQYDIGQEVDVDKERRLYWEEPRYAGEHSEARQRYPFHVISDHMRTRTHSQWWDCDYMKEWEPEPVVRINPDDAVEYGIVEGDKVKLYNDFGSVVMKANINAGLPSKTLSSPRSFTVDEFIEGHFSNLCSKEYNQIAANMVYNDVVVAIEKM